jgi:GTPase SAR1 family protein
LIGNKIDLPDRQVSERDGDDLAKEMSAFFIETSAKADKNVTEAFTTMATEMLNAAEKSEPKGKAVDIGRGVKIEGVEPERSCC